MTEEQRREAVKQKSLELFNLLGYDLSVMSKGDAIELTHYAYVTNAVGEVRTLPDGTLEQIYFVEDLSVYF